MIHFLNMVLRVEATKEKMNGFCHKKNFFLTSRVENWSLGVGR